MTELAPVDPIDGGAEDKGPPIASAATSEVTGTVPIEVRLALRILVNHAQPGWSNTVAILQRWIDLGFYLSASGVDGEEQR